MMCYKNGYPAIMWIHTQTHLQLAVCLCVGQFCSRNGENITIKEEMNGKYQNYMYLDSVMHPAVARVPVIARPLP